MEVKMKNQCSQRRRRRKQRVMRNGFIQKDGSETNETLGIGKIKRKEAPFGKTLNQE